MLNSIMYAGAFCAAVIGAGFITGCEIQTYFVRYSAYDKVFVILSAVLMGVLFYALIRFCSVNNIKSSEEFFRLGYGAVPVLTQGAVYFLMISVFAAMIASGAELTVQYTGINRYIAAILVGATLSAASVCDVRRIIDMSGALGIIMFVLITVVCGYLLAKVNKAVFFEYTGQTAESIRYAGYNILSAIPVIIGISSYNGKRSFAGVTAVISTLILCIVMIAIYNITVTYSELGINSAMPMLAAVGYEGGAVYHIYSFITAAAVLTTALCNGCGIAQKLCCVMSRKTAAVLLATVAVPLSFSGLDVIVKHMYGICGALGFILILLMIKNTKNVEIDRKQE